MKAHIAHFTYSFQWDSLYITSKNNITHNVVKKNIYKTKYALAYTFPFYTKEYGFYFHKILTTWSLSDQFQGLLRFKARNAHFKATLVDD